MPPLSRRPFLKLPVPEVVGIAIGRHLRPVPVSERAMSDSNATTEDHPPRDRQATTSPARDSFVPDQRVIAGSGSPMATETRWLLQQRLRAASLVLVLGFGLFFVRSVCLY